MTNNARDDFDTSASVKKTTFTKTLTMFCQNRKWPNPNFRLIDTSGPSHMPTFTYECAVNQITEVADAGSKRMSRNLAAEKVLKRLELELSKGNEIFNIDVEKMQNEKMSNNTTYDYDPSASVKKNTFIESLVMICQTRKWPNPKFRLITTCGLAHMPTFIYECTVNQITEVAAAGSKRMSRNLAAEKVLKRLELELFKRNEIFNNSVKKMQNEKMSNNLTDDYNPSASVKKNTFIESLVLFCVSRKWPNPKFRLIDTSGPSHMQTFIYECTVNQITEVAAASSKIMSRHLAAEKILNRLELDPSKRKEIVDNDVEEMQNEEMSPPIDALVKFCATNKVQKPSFTVLKKEGPPHDVLFTVQCKVGDIVETSIGRKINHSKQTAAANVLDKLKSGDLGKVLNHLRKLNLAEKSNSDSVRSSDDVTPFQEPRVKYLALLCSACSLDNPRYVLKNESGPAHFKNFTYECHVGELIESASAHKKKTCQHLVAEKMIKRLETLMDEDEIDISSPEVLPIDVLKDFCSANKLPQPLFGLISEKGPCHDKVFTYYCKVNTTEASAVAKTKAKAKHMAAATVLYRLLVKEENCIRNC